MPKSSQPWPWRVRYGKWLDDDHSDWVWDWIQWPIICVLRRLMLIWPHKHKPYSEHGWGRNECIYCSRVIPDPERGAP